MIDVATVALAAGAPVLTEPESWQMLLADGTEVTVRRATLDDVGAVADLHARCSLTSRLRRYLAGTRCPTDMTLARLLSPAGRSLPRGRRRGRAGHRHGEPDVGGRHHARAGPSGRGFVAAAPPRHGPGPQLVAVALEAGAHSVKAVVHSGNTPMVRIMAGLAHRLHREYDGGMLTLIAFVRSDGNQTHRLPSSIRLSQSS